MDLEVLEAYAKLKDEVRVIDEKNQKLHKEIYDLNKEMEETSGNREILNLFDIYIDSLFIKDEAKAMLMAYHKGEGPFIIPKGDTDD